MPTMPALRVSFGNQQRVPTLARYFCHGTHYRPEHAFRLAVDRIARNWATIRHPQANSGPEYFDQAMSHGFYRVAFRKEIDWTLDGLQVTLDSWVDKPIKLGSQHE